MAHYLAELYSPKPLWLALDQAARRQFFEAIGSGMGALSALGVEAIALGETNAATLHAAGHKFFAIWRAPDAAAIDALVSGIAASGWHDYFETINAAGSGVNLSDHLGQLAAL
ncbi:hypothetical protein C7U60_20005 [Mesorhizobium plurifarium]|uniref:DUF6616 family protein n=1 Tax=Sinorhizobium arboris TaxID=76745 RepID=UPI0004270F7A|nr:DUF6616 family protein [Sinorhizobium arboris]PST17363.1 hypothetical protein C7U60_20005 [Mesorhizobium plurifarium]